MLEIKDWHEMPHEKAARATWLKEYYKVTKATIETIEAKMGDRESERSMTEAPLDYIALNDVTYEDPFSVGSTISPNVQKHVKTESEKLASCSKNLSNRGIANKLSDEVNGDDTKADIDDSAVLADQKMSEADHDGLTDDRDLVEDESKPSADVSSVAPVAMFTKSDGLEDVAMDDVDNGGCEAARINSPEQSDEVNGGDVHALAQAETPSDATHKEAEADHIVPENFPSAANNCAQDGNGKHRNHDGKAKVKFNPTKVSKQVNKKDKKGDDTTLAEKVRAVFSGAQEGGGLGDHGGPKSANGSGMTTTPLSAKYED